LALGCVLACAFALRVWGVKQGLPYVYNIDEAANFVPSAVSFFFTDSLNPHYFVNPPAFSYLLHLVFAFWYGGGWPFGSARQVAEAYAIDPSSIFTLARVTSAVLGTAAVGFVYLTGARLFDRRVALLAAALMAVAFLPVFYSHLALNDVPALLPATISVWGSAGVLRFGRPRDYLIAGVALGGAAATKYTAGIVLLPFAVACAYRVAMAPVPLRGRVLGWAGLAAVAAAAAFVVANPHALLSYDEFQEGLRRQESESDLGKLGLTEDNGIRHYLWTVTWSLGWLPALAALGAAALAFVRNRWRSAFLVLWPAALILFLGLQGRYFGRWLMPAIPALALLAAYGAVALADAAGRSQRARGVALVGFAVLLCAQGTFYSIHVDRVLARDDTRNLLRDWMVQNVPPNSKVVVEPVVPDAWFTDPGIPPPVSRAGRRWIKFPTGRSTVDNRGRPIRGGVGRTVKPEDYERTLRPELIDSYERGGYCWVVIGSTQYGRALATPKEVPRAIAYYNELSGRGTPVWAIRPYRPGEGPVEFNFDWSFDYYPRAYFRPGPELTVYRLRGGRCEQTGSRSQTRIRRTK
jgi:hypothetical protein